jgi:trimethylamine--corrinoid protein Co-methyltransferase
MSSLLVAMSGANYIHDIAGLMESDLTVSYEKLVLDNEILGMCQRVLRGIEVTDETLATDLIIEKGPGSDFYAEEHTVRHMRSEFFTPAVTSRELRSSYTTDQSAASQARKFVEEIRRQPPASRIGKGLREELLASYPEIRPTSGA